MEPSQWKVERIEEGHRGRFELTRFAPTVGEQMVGKMTYTRAGDAEIIVDHTETDDSIRGMGGGMRLFEAMVGWARESGVKVRATCPFTLAMFERHPETHDVLAS